VHPHAATTLAGVRRGARGLTRWTVSLSLLVRAVVGSAVLAVLVAGTFTLLLVAVSHLSMSTNVQASSRDQTSATLDVEQVVNELESSLRAFLISGNDRFLVTWARARAALGPSLGRMERLLGGRQSQSRQAAEVAEATRAYVSEYGLPIIAIYRVNPGAARAPVATQEGLLRIGTIRTLLARLLSSEATVASADTAAAKRDATRSEELAIAGLSVAAVLLVGYGVFLVRGIAGPARRVAAGASGIAAGDLSTRLPEEGAAEIHALTSSFNAMARSLEQGKRELEAQNEQLRESERLKAQLVSIVSHELRTPLTSILGYARLLRSRDFGKADVDRYVGVIQEQGERLTSLIDHFLDSESIESGQIELVDEEFDLRTVMMAEAQLVADKVTRHRVELEVGATPLPIRGDRDRIAQVAANLLENAVKYSPDGGLVGVHAGVVGSTARVEVSDEGIGVPAEQQGRVFTKFFRGDAEATGIPGSGLGLALSREIVEAHGGTMGFASGESGGSRFWFELPLTTGRETATQADAVVRAPEPEPPGLQHPAGGARQANGRHARALVE